MACVGLVNGCRTVASVLSDEDWKKVVKISKGRQVLMPDTKLPAQAKTLRRDGGITRYFSHFPGESPEGYSSTESPDHIAMKVAIYKKLVALGIQAELEDGVDDWRADILVGDSAFAPRLAIEVQISPQSAQRTYERTEQRNRSGVPTLWIFGSIGLTGVINEDLARTNPVFVAKTPLDAADIASAVCRGQAFYDDLSHYQQTPARPVALLINCACGDRWLYPFGCVLLLNRISGETAPMFISCFRTSRVGKGLLPTARMRAVERYFDLGMSAVKVSAEKYGVGFGRPSEVWHRYGRFGNSKSGIRVWERSYSCPTCTSTPEPLTRGLPKNVALSMCPVPVATTVDARSVLSVTPSWRMSRKDGWVESVMCERRWKDEFIYPLRSAIAQA
ncbi:MAG: hypothetical protein QOI97_5333 [Pseudomonas sp.]|nr:competence protein CoiA family protein [Pseudomonas rustica]MEA3172385.1 hypothetical protein [Pseudomonas sp.]OEC41938.1 hypothetical protein A7K61_26030 [Pseudomonas sp. AP42]OKP65427.1 hypothetical protein BTR19_29685 [Pseudomonas fluorescens]